MNTRHIFFTLCILITGLLSAEPDLTQPLTLPELVDIALQNNPETRIAWWNARRAASALGIAESEYYPRIGVEAQANHGRDFRFINGPDTNYTLIGADLTLSMMLYDFGGRSANVNAAKMALLAANWQNNWTIQKVMVNVLQNAYSALHSQETMHAALISLKDAEKMLYMAKELNRTGLTPVSDVYTSQATLAQMRMDLAEQKSLLDIRKGKLAASLGLSADVCLQLAALEDLPGPQKQETADLICLAKKQRADLMAKQARLSESYSRIDKARAGYAPKLSLTGRGGGEHYLHDKANAAHYQIALNLEIPLFSGFDTVYQNRMAYEEAQTTTEELAQLELDISLEVLTQSRTLEASQEMLCYAEDNLQNAIKAYDGVLEKYKAGKERIAEVSNALRQLAAARVRYSDIKTRYYVSMANLAYATGTLAPNMENTCE
jgi:outer membrane protein